MLSKHYEDLNSMNIREELSRFMKFVDTQGECWNWTGAKSKKGYGSFSITRGGKKITLSSHRISYFVFNGPFDESLQLLHSCDNPSCVNPQHLTPGTNLDNILDKLSKGRQSRKVVHKGESTPRSVLKEAQVRQIVELLNTTDYTHQEIGNIYNVSAAAIGQIACGKNWKHLNLLITRPKQMKGTRLRNKAIF